MMATGETQSLTEKLEIKFPDVYCLYDEAGSGRRQINPQSQSFLEAGSTMEPRSSVTLIQSTSQNQEINIKSVIIFPISPILYRLFA